MASAAELSFKVERAKQWKQSVQSEIEMVNSLLKQVEEEVKEAPYEDDTIMKGLHSAGEALESSFELLNNQFMEEIEGIDRIIETWSNMIADLLSEIAETIRTIGQM